MAQELLFGLCTDQNMDWPTTLERWRYYEGLGFDSLWVCDHFDQPSRPGGPYHEGWTLLAALAAATERVRVGVLVSSNTFRHPGLLAKEAITVDHISNGRLEVGIGAGWYVPEHEAYGLEFEPPRQLVDRFEEAVAVIDSMLRNDVTTFHGDYYDLTDAPCRPRPLQLPRPPLTIGAKGPRMLGICAQWADRWNSSGTVDDLRVRNEILSEHCERIGRDPDEIIRSLYGWAAIMPDDPWASADAFEEVIGRYAEAGINEFVVDHPGPERFPILERVATDVIPRMRAERSQPSS